MFTSAKKEEMIFPISHDPFPTTEVFSQGDRCLDEQYRIVLHDMTKNKVSLDTGTSLIN